MPEPDYESLRLRSTGQDDNDSEDIIQSPASLFKRPTLISIYSSARKSYSASASFAKYSLRDSLISEAQINRDVAKQAFRDARPWIVHKSWPMIKYFFLHFLAILGPVLSIACLSIISEINAWGLSYSETCLPDGSFSINDEKEYNPWTLSGIFQITLGFGTLHFSTVKIIDVIWDVVIGRGVQAMLATLAYFVFTRSIQRTMEASPVAYGTFEALAFNSASLTQILKLLSNITTNHGARGKLQVIWIVIASAYVVGFSTLSSAMTGYAGNVEARVNISTISVPLDKLELVQYTIHDFWRVGLSSPYITTQTNTGLPLAENDNCGYQYYSAGSFNHLGNLNWTVVTKGCDLIAAATLYVTEHGLNGTSPKSSEFYTNTKSVNLTEPTLNITSSYVNENYFSLYGQSNCTYGTSGSTAYNGEYNGDSYSCYESTYEGPSDWKNATFLYENTTYSWQDVSHYGQCVQIATYKWGFSFLLLFITFVLTTIWSIGMYVMWLDAHLHSRYNRAGRQIGTYRAVLDLAKAMRKDMGEDATENLSNTELKEKINRRLNGGVIGYQMLDQPGTGHEMLPLTRWESMKIWWEYHGWKTWGLKKKIWVVLLSTACLAGALALIITEALKAPGRY